MQIAFHYVISNVFQNENVFRFCVQWKKKGKKLKRGKSDLLSNEQKLIIPFWCFVSVFDFITERFLSFSFLLHKYIKKSLQFNWFTQENCFFVISVFDLQYLLLVSFFKRKKCFFRKKCCPLFWVYLKKTIYVVLSKSKKRKIKIKHRTSHTFKEIFFCYFSSVLVAVCVQFGMMVELRLLRTTLNARYTQFTLLCSAVDSTTNKLLFLLSHERVYIRAKHTARRANETNCTCVRVSLLYIHKNIYVHTDYYMVAVNWDAFLLLALVCVVSVSFYHFSFVLLSCFRFRVYIFVGHIKSVEYMDVHRSAQLCSELFAELSKYMYVFSQFLCVCLCVCECLRMCLLWYKWNG